MYKERNVTFFFVIKGVCDYLNTFYDRKCSLII